MDSLIGQRLGKYQIETLVGRGGMATVYRAHDTVLNRSVAIKVLDPALAVDPRAVERFRREAVTAANLEHSSIVRVYDVAHSGSIYYIAMRYVQGTSLREILRDNGPLPLETAVNVVKSVAAALHYAHRHGVIHRDVKPGNILVEPDGTVVLTDFGISRAADSAQSSLTATGQVMGTADYLAPEQISGRPAEARSDVYSLGVVLYEMLTGVTPFSGETTASILYRQVHDDPPSLRSINPRLPAELQPVIDRCLAKNPALRYSDPLDLARDLEDTTRWLPPGSPWLAKNRQPGPNIAAPSSGSFEAVDPYVTASVRPATRPHTQPRPYVEEPQEAQEPRPSPPVISPQARAGRRTTLLLAAVLLLIAGAVVLAAAIGVIPGVGKAGTGAARFEDPSAATYNGPLRKGNGVDFHLAKALVPPTIDGDLSDWRDCPVGPFAAPYPTYINPKSRKQYGGPSDLSAAFYFSWDDNNFYIGAIITDDVHVQTAQTRGYNLYNGDDVEFWFDTDLAGDFARSQTDKDDYQLGISPGNFSELVPEAVFWNPDHNDARNKLVRVAARPRTGVSGYTLEAAVPWQALGAFRPQPGGAVGFAASAGDNDQPATPMQEMMLSTTPRLQYQQPFTFGNLYF